MTGRYGRFGECLRFAILVLNGGGWGEGATERPAVIFIAEDMKQILTGYVRRDPY